MVAYYDQDVLALAEVGRDGLLVAPRHHVSGLEAMPSGAADLLAFLRRAVTAVEAYYGASGATIEPTDVSGSPGHVCYRVVPTIPFSQTRPADAADDDVAARAGTLGSKLRSPPSPPQGWHIVASRPQG